MNDDIRIVVFHRGWIAVGKYTATLDEVTLTNCADIRRWGTTQGLGEIAKNGPTSNTVLDPSTTQRCHPLAVVKTYDCNLEKWIDVINDY